MSTGHFSSQVVIAFASTKDINGSYLFFLSNPLLNPFNSHSRLSVCTAVPVHSHYSLMYSVALGSYIVSTQSAVGVMYGAR